ncbi:hypothetical protein J2Z83_001560 [Virgibacillus natechei]|uniref:Uncharacterized protein n=1 Tax=Virgibacillus natechei TaxID=1216297 RepID=A0ABS4IGK9_9BACI|nr:hypothetical protein [Virgibacillus natechei]
MRKLLDMDQHATPYRGKIVIIVIIPTIKKAVVNILAKIGIDIPVFPTSKK